MWGSNRLTRLRLSTVLNPESEQFETGSYSACPAPSLALRNERPRKQTNFRAAPGTGQRLGSLCVAWGLSRRESGFPRDSARTTAVLGLHAGKDPTGAGYPPGEAPGPRDPQGLYTEQELPARQGLAPGAPAPARMCSRRSWARGAGRTEPGSREALGLGAFSPPRVWTVLSAPTQSPCITVGCCSTESRPL